MQSLSVQLIERTLSVQLISISCKVLRFTHPGPAHGPAPSTAWHLPGVGLGWGVTLGTFGVRNGAVERRARGTEHCPITLLHLQLRSGSRASRASCSVALLGYNHWWKKKKKSTGELSGSTRQPPLLPAGLGQHCQPAALIFVSLPLPDKKGWGQAQALQRAEAGACSARRVWSYQPPENPCLALPVCCSYWFGLSWAISNNEEHIWESYSLL